MSVKAKGAPAPAPLLRNVGNAPVVYFDNVPVYGTYMGNIEIELSARALLPKTGDGVLVEAMCSGHLRCSPASAMQLIESLQRAIKLLEQQMADQQKAKPEEPAQPLHS